MILYLSSSCRPRRLVRASSIFFGVLSHEMRKRSVGGTQCFFVTQTSAVLQSMPGIQNAQFNLPLSLCADCFALLHLLCIATCPAAMQWMLSRVLCFQAGARAPDAKNDAVEADPAQRKVHRTNHWGAARISKGVHCMSQG